MAARICGERIAAATVDPNGWPQQPWICAERMAAATVDL
jgi:hypothetical protein